MDTRDPGIAGGQVGKPLREKPKDQTSRVAAVVKSGAAPLPPFFSANNNNNKTVKPSRIAKQWQEATLLCVG